MACFVSQPDQDNTLDDLKWKNRIVLIYADFPTNTEYQEQLKLLQNEALSLEDRDMVLFSIFSKGGKAHEISLADGWQDQLRKRYFSDQQTIQIVLIGKDGGIKMRKSELTNPSELFDLIDQMPMRRAEMKKN